MLILVWCNCRKVIAAPVEIFIFSTKFSTITKSRHDQYWSYRFTHHRHQFLFIPSNRKCRQKHLPASTRIVNNTKDLTPEELAHSKIFQYAEYEDLDFDRLNSDPKYLACSFVYRKGLIRKHYLANTIALYTAKNPDSILKRAFPESFNIEVDYAEFWMILWMKLMNFVKN